MTQEERQLLLKDLCARLPHEVKISLNTYGIQNIGILDAVYPNDECIIVDHLEKRVPLFNGFGTVDYGRFSLEESNFKPYLRPMSSMTEDEKEELVKKHIKLVFRTQNDWSDVAVDIDGFDWLNAHHFDYRGLIPKGLAIEALEGMYN